MSSRVSTIPFTEDFIARLSDRIERDYLAKGKDLSRLVLVFGGRRPSLFLKKELSRRLKHVYIPPTTLSIDDLMADLAPKRRLLADLDHCYLIYHLAKEHAPNVLIGREGFVQFLPWAREIIHFIEQLDLELTPSNALQGLKAQASIGFDVPLEINRLLKSLFILREVYHAHLDQHGLTSRGYRYLQASEQASRWDDPLVEEIIFCNFFYLHRSENAVIKALHAKGKASLLLQGDQRRWPALRRIAKEFDAEIMEGATVKEPAFKLQVSAAFDAHAQAGLISRILAGIPVKERAVIVLPNPDALLPVLSTIATQMDDFNISLGYPLKRSALCMLLDLMIEAQHHRKPAGYYAKDYLRVLRHPLVKSLGMGLPEGVTRCYLQHLETSLTGSSTPTAVSGLLFIKIEDIANDEILFETIQSELSSKAIEVSLSLLKETVCKIHQQLFADWENLNNLTNLASAIETFCAYINSQTGLASYPLNVHVAERLMAIAREWLTIGVALEKFLPLDLLNIMQERLNRETVAFKGSPLKGLQVLGLIETRSLTFDHVIIADVNEGVLPNLSIYEPLIPREVMIGLNIDRLELEEEIQRYQFMRLISSAKHVHLIYQERSDKERSRFIEELIWRQEQAQGQVNVVPIIRPSFRVTLSKHQRQAAKTPAMLEYLKNFVFSATSINTYKRNPYEFYLSYVLGLRPKEDLLDDPEARHVGTFLHELLEDAFKPFLGRKPQLDHHFNEQVMTMFEERFDKHFGRGQRSDAFLLKVVLENRLNRFLDVERARVDRDVATLLHVERKFADTIDLPCGRVNLSLRLDRLEKTTSNEILVIDYKTGDVDDASVQMPLYLHYLKRQFPDVNVNAAYYMLKTQELDLYIKPRGKRVLDDVLEGFKKDLGMVMGEIFNQEIPLIDQGDEIE